MSTGDDCELYFDGKKFLSSRCAGEVSGYTNDYIARLCRQEKVLGRMVGRTWYVEECSFASFIKKSISQKEQRKKTLAEERKQEYVATTKQRKSFFAYPLRAAGVFTIALFVIVSGYFIGTGEFFAGTKQFFTEREIKHAEASIVSSVGEFFSSIWKYAADTFSSFVFDESTEQRGGDFSGEEGQTLALNQERDGVVVVPSSGTDEDDERKKEIVEAFSDEIEIVPDKDGRSGIIKPVFKRQEDQEYLYVLVPIDEDGATAN